MKNADCMFCTVLDNLLRVMGILLIIILVWMSDHALRIRATVFLPRGVRSVPFGLPKENFGYHFITSAAPFLTMFTLIEPRHRGK